MESIEYVSSQMQRVNDTKHDEIYAWHELVNAIRRDGYAWAGLNTGLTVCVVVEVHFSV